MIWNIVAVEAVAVAVEAVVQSVRNYIPNYKQMNYPDRGDVRIRVKFLIQSM